MNEILERLTIYLAAVVRYRWYAIAVAAAICVFGWAVVALLPDRYHASARIYVDTKSVLQPLLKGLAVEPVLGQEIAAMQQSLLSRPNLEDVAGRAGLDLGVPSREQREAMIIRLRKSISLGASGQSMFVIDVVYDDPGKATRIAQALVDVLVDSSVGLSREDMAQAGGFLDQQIQQYEVKLEVAEARSAEFKQANLAYLPSSGGFQSGLDAARQRQNSIGSDLRDARTERDILKAEIAITPQTIEPSSSQQAGSGAQPGNMHAKLADLLTRYTEKHPDVVALRRKIEDRERSGEGTIETDLDGGSRPTISIAPYVVPNPSFSALKLRVIDKEAEVAKLQEKLRLAREDVQELESRAYQAPQVEAQMAKLNRDYDVLKSQYEELLSRREQARVSKDRDESGDKVQFRVVDPPRVPVLPQGPPRPLLLMAVLPIAIAAGIGLAVALSLLRPVYTSASEVSADFDLPVIGSVSLIASGGAGRRKTAEALGMAVLAICLLGTFALLMVVESRVGLGKVVTTTFANDSLQPSLDLVLHGLGAGALRVGDLNLGVK